MWLELGTKHQKTLMKDPKTPQWNMAALCRTALAALAAFVALAPRSVLGGKHWTISSSWKMGSIRRRGPGSCWTHDFQIRTTLGARKGVDSVDAESRFHWKPAVEPPNPGITKGQSIIKRNSVKKRSVRNTRRTLAILPQWQKYWRVMNHYEAYASQDTKSLQFNREFWSALEGHCFKRASLPLGS